jgi:hypothetical protein
MGSFADVETRMIARLSFPRRRLRRMVPLIANVVEPLGLRMTVRLLDRSVSH